MADAKYGLAYSFDGSSVLRRADAAPVSVLAAGAGRLSGAGFLGKVGSGNPSDANPT